MSAIVNGTLIRQLDRPVASEESITETDAGQPARVARLFVRLLAEVADLRRRFWPNRIDYEDIPVATASTTYKFDHGFGGRVRWWLVQWKPTSTTANHVPLLTESASTDNNSLVLVNLDITGIGAFAGKVTVRVEEAG